MPIDLSGGCHLAETDKGLRHFPVFVCFLAPHSVHRDLNAASQAQGNYLPTV